MARVGQGYPRWRRDMMMMMIYEYICVYIDVYEYMFIHIYIYIYIHFDIYRCLYICLYKIKNRKFSTVVKGDRKASFLIGTTPMCKGENCSLSWNVPLYA